MPGIGGSHRFYHRQKLTKRITAPINDIDLDAPLLPDGYDELIPLLKKIETLKRKLSAQVAEIENRTSTISAITGNMKEGLLLLDGSGSVLMANESVLQILDISNAVNSPVIELCRDAAFLSQAKKCLAGEKTETLLHLADRFYSVYFNPVRSSSMTNGAVVIFIDITERYAAETQRKEFSANVSHELKTPLTTIAGLSEMIADGTAKDKDIRLFADKIRNQSERLLDIIDDIIKLSEFDEGEAERDYSRFNLFDVADTVINVLREKAAERDIAVQLQGDSQLTVTANKRMIDELLSNLVDNAIKYNRAGGSVLVTLSAADGRVQIGIKDTGIGISGEHLNRIYERFYRVDASRSKKTGGTGLGLSIVKHIVEFHRGSIEVESEVGTGSLFTVDLPQHK